MIQASFLGRNGWLLAPVVGLGAGVALLLFPLRLALSSFLPVLITLLFSLGLWLFYSTRRPNQAIAALAESAAFLFTVMPLLVIYNYATTMAGRPLLDASFARLDAFLGFDWMQHLAWVKSWPGLGEILTLAYASSLPQIPLALIILAFCRRLKALRSFVLLFAGTLMVTLTLSAIFPAAGAYVYFAPPASMAVGFDPQNGIWHLAQFTDLRDGTMTTLDLRHLSGLVTFPSFHTILAVLTAWALRDVRYVALPAALLNALVIVSTLAIGGHHLFDVIAGAAIAIAGIALMDGRSLLRQASWQKATTPA